MKSQSKVELYTRYPLSSVVLYNATTVVHYLVGASGIALGYSSPAGYVLAGGYLAFALGEMYVHMPLTVCRTCPYHRLDGSLCISGLNVMSRRLAAHSDVADFPLRARGAFCPNNLYLAALVLPIAAIIPSLIMNFSLIVLAALLVLVALMAFRFFVLFKKVACVHCRAKNVCPNARSMGLAD